MTSSARDILWITVIGGMVLFANLGGPRLWDRDEPRNAGCAMEMLQRGDWITPVFNGQLRTHKPILLYWLMMTAYFLFGDVEFAARFWSAASGLGTALLTYGIGRRLFSRTVGFWAAVILLTTFMFDVAGRAATPDSILIFWMTAAIFFYVFGTFPKSRANSKEHEVPMPVRMFPSWPVAALMYASMGVAVLAKGPVGFILPTAVIGMYLLVLRLPPHPDCDACSRWRRVGTRMLALIRPFAPRHFLSTCWLMRPITALVMVLLVALPWYWAVGVRTDGAWLRGFFWDHNFGRAVQSLEGHHGSIFYYPVALLIGFFPWSVFAAPVTLEVSRQLRRRSNIPAGIILALCWTGVYLGLFSVARTKLPSYITPCYPGVALLVGWFVQRWLRDEITVSPRWFMWAFATLGTIGVIALIAIAVAAQRLLPGAQWLAVIGLVPIITAMLAANAWRRRMASVSAATFAVGATVIMTLVLAVAAQQVDHRRTFDRLLACTHRTDAEPRIGTFGTVEPSWVFYAGHPLDALAIHGSSARSGDTASKLARVQKVPLQKPAIDLHDYLEQGANHYLLTTDAALSKLKQHGVLPTGVTELARTYDFLKKRQLILLGWPEHAAAKLAKKPSSTRR